MEIRETAVRILLLIRKTFFLLPYLCTLALIADSPPDHFIDDRRLINAKKTPHEWITYGGNYTEDRYSTLAQITKENVKQLGLAWTINLGITRGIESTPLVANGVMYVTGSWSRVYAINALTGELQWKFDPKVPAYYGEKACCDVVNRGVALYKDYVYVGTLDGRLIALRASSGQPAWSVQTVDTARAYTVTGPPRIVAGKVIIGNGGAEYGVRGYVTAYDAMTGKQIWRTYTVPGDPSKRFESEALAQAAKTWTGKWWEYGGGGTAWDAMAYDPFLNLLYVGTGNGSPWNRQHRSPGGGDNLYISSILALNPSSGELVWHYQTTPGESWDFTATQHLILADITIRGRLRKVIMQAPKNGFFYVIDRTNGQFISAKPYTFVNWATGIDSLTGRPIESDFSRYTSQNAEIFPSPIGGHNWQPMAYNPKEGLVYIPIQTNSMVYGHDSAWTMNKVGGMGSGTGWNVGIGHDNTRPLRTESKAPKQMGKLIAWRPDTQREVWSVDHPVGWNGGILTTTTGLVFQGTATGDFSAYDAKTGTVLWQMNLGTGIIAPPITYQLDGKQYVSIAVGWGGVIGLGYKFTPTLHPGTIYTFALGANQAMPSYEPVPERTLTRLQPKGSKAEIKHGETLYKQYCDRCHGGVGGGGGVLPDLARSPDHIHENFQAIVRNGLLTGNGMPNFGRRLGEQDVKDLQSFILSQAEIARKK
ncbi:PQQ-dependent dehydrogenase, methanol/ethanol family [Dyadobacter psychrophilus]|uniref:Quinohemoprotein ethanol dehydrogenase n=1 Tax=Dyadobacter psychrophilus TaxID=651661 RepID=A0A1T5H581_9BACT|nr:PQQ-dependent dehydrogenase, methanol/ethanol family [Dyadobacter psychrophilus]SKC15814.1 quinohemoprotein ethanol dehydrogenase [Dyadobacter psychrophilus]